MVIKTLLSSKMKLEQILLCVLLIIFIPISLSNFIIKFIFSDCDPHLYFNQYHEYINRANISFYQDTFIMSYVFSCINMFAFSFLTMYKLFTKKYLANTFIRLTILMLFVVIICSNFSWLFFEALVIDTVPADKCFLRTANIIESSLGLIYTTIMAIIFCYSMGKNHPQERVGYNYV